MDGVDRIAQQKLMETARSVGFLEGMSVLLWTKAGPELADEAVVEFDKRVSTIAEYFGLDREGYRCAK